VVQHIVQQVVVLEFLLIPLLVRLKMVVQVVVTEEQYLVD
jgi:hypothetical protein